MSLYQIIQTKNGKETVKMIDSRARCNNRIKELRSSYRGKHGITFKIVKAADTTVKFEEKPAPSGYQSGDYPSNPQVIK